MTKLRLMVKVCISLASAIIFTHFMHIVTYADDAYEIVLTNERSYQVSQYEKKDGQCCFFKAGGYVCISDDQIASIRKIKVNDSGSDKNNVDKGAASQSLPVADGRTKSFLPPKKGAGKFMMWIRR